MAARLTDLLTRIESLKSKIDALRPLAPQQVERVMQKLRLEWNYHSNALEGNHLTLGETRAFLLHGITAQGKPFRDYLEIRGHDQAIRYLETLVHQERPLTEADIRALHQLLLGEPRQIEAITEAGQPTRKWIEPGRYKRQPNHVRTSTGEIYYYASPEETPVLMGELVRWYREEVEKGTLHPLILAATFHYRFVRIHPFDDGNGRMARLLMNLSLMQAGYVPVVVRVEAKEAYLLALEAADSDDDLEPFIALIGDELVRWWANLESEGELTRGESRRRGYGGGAEGGNGAGRG